MIWLTWRQFRTQAVVAGVALVAVVAAYAATAPTLAGLARDNGFTGCTSGCQDAANAFIQQAQASFAGDLYYVGLGVLFLAPALIGAFWGAPLVAREFEAGTHRLIWNQTVSRSRWLAVKLGGVALGTAALTGLVSLVVTWWDGSIDRASADRIMPYVYAARGLVPVGYALFALALGVTLGLLLRRTIPAMAVTLVLVAAAQVLAPFALRPALIESQTYTRAVNPSEINGIMINGRTHVGKLNVASPVPGAWVLSDQVLDNSGRPFAPVVDPQTCGPDAPKEACLSWMHGLSLQQRIRYVPAARFWALQWRELGVFVALAGLLAAFCGWWIRRRVS